MAVDRSVTFSVGEIAITHQMSTISSSGFDTAIGAEKPIPEKIDHGEVAIPGAVMAKMKLLLSPEPRETAKPRSRNMILIVDIVVPAE